MILVKLCFAAYVVTPSRPRWRNLGFSECRSGGGGGEKVVTRGIGVENPENHEKHEKTESVHFCPFLDPPRKSVFELFLGSENREKWGPKFPMSLVLGVFGVRKNEKSSSPGTPMFYPWARLRPPLTHSKSRSEQKNSSLPDHKGALLTFWGGTSVWGGTLKLVPDPPPAT